MGSGAPDDAEMMRLLEAIGDSVRLRILFLLGCADARNVGEITALLADSGSTISRPAVSHHLRVLKEAGILSPERRGQEIHYRLLREPVVRGLRSLADAVETCRPEVEHLPQT